MVANSGLKLSVMLLIILELPLTPALTASAVVVVVITLDIIFKKSIRNVKQS